MTSAPPAAPAVRLAVGITGHRGNKAAIADDASRVAAALRNIVARIDECLASEASSLPDRLVDPPLLNTLLAHGVDQMAAAAASDRGWDIVAPLPFGHALNVAVNAQPDTRDDGQALLAGGDASDPQVQARAQGIRQWSDKARLFELADRDAEIAALFDAMLEYPADMERFRDFSAAASAQAALAGRVMIEQSDLVIGVWDGAIRNQFGGTGHTIMTALEMGTPVLLLDPASPEDWAIISSVESLTCWQDSKGQDLARLHSIITSALGPRDGKSAGTLGQAHWRPHSSWLSGLYRRIEAMFSGEPRPFRSLVQSYERPEDIATESGAPLLAAARAIAGADPAFVDAVATRILPAFAWADGISTWLSDGYRSGMIANFLLSALAIIMGIVYIPLGVDDGKWMFAVAEFLMLASILIITWIGGRRRLHARWFETRRVAEYLRHAPIMLFVGVARPAGRWPRGTGTTWPESTARHSLRALGLPAVTVTNAFLQGALKTLLSPHVANQLTYHHAKAKRLTTVHHRLDHLAETLFKLAVLSVATYLLLKGAAALHLVPHDWPTNISKLSSFLGVALPTLGASIAGIRFFGDFERFAAISEVTAGKLGQVQMRIDQLLAGPESAVDYAGVSKLAHEIDDIVVSEIENWQAVFSGKHIALPA